MKRPWKHWFCSPWIANYGAPILLIGDDQLYQLSFINVDIKDIHIDLSMFISYDKL